MIYLLEDDAGIRKLITYTMKTSGMEAEGFAAPSLFYEALAKEKPELILLDIMLPEEDGLSVLARLKASPDTENIPVIILTAKSSEFDKVIGLDSGADDYMTKPFGMMELLSRVRALLRRTRPSHSTEEDFRLGNLFVSPSRHVVEVEGAPVTLSLKEFKLLCLLLEKGGAVADRDEILTTIWGYSFDGESRTVDVHIRNLRQKLGDAGECIETVKGIGYKIDKK
jgi:two-component system alkaline phosphatase synthesis response regulator PhoP